MRSGKSYLNAYLNCWILDPNKSWPSCLQPEETFVHAILSCSNKALQRTRHLPDVLSIGPEAGIWTSMDLILGLAKYIRSTYTGYPPLMLQREHTPRMWSEVIGFWFFFPDCQLGFPYLLRVVFDDFCFNTWLRIHRLWCMGSVFHHRRKLMFGYFICLFVWNQPFVYAIASAASKFLYINR